MKRAFVLRFAASLVLLAGIAAFSNGQERAGAPVSTSSVRVKIDNFSFTPPTVTVPAGTKVTWVNADDIPHTVVADDQSFKSKVLDTDEAFTYTFTKAGTYSYFCSVHPKMTAKIVVQ
jgi:plastocyanin